MKQVALQVMKQVPENSFSSYILCGQFWWCNIKWFLSDSKTTSANLCKPIHEIINYLIFICSFESGKCGKERKKCFCHGNDFIDIHYCLITSRIMEN